MKFDHNKSIPWKLIYDDLFSRETYVDKSGNDILEGFYRLWYHTLAEGLASVSSNIRYKIYEIPGRNLNRFSLSYSLDEENFFIDLDLDNYLQEIYNIKSILLEGYKGYNLEENKKTIIKRLAKSHCLIRHYGNKEDIYHELKRLSSVIGLNLELIDRYTSDLLNECIKLIPEDSDYHAPGSTKKDESPGNRPNDRN